MNTGSGCEASRFCKNSLQQEVRHYVFVILGWGEPDRRLSPELIVFMDLRIFNQNGRLKVSKKKKKKPSKLIFTCISVQIEKNTMVVSKNINFYGWRDYSLCWMRLGICRL